MTVRKIKNSWWVDFRAGHLRHRKRSPENTKVGAEAYEANLRQKLARGEPIDKPMAPQKEVSFKQFAGQWFKEYVTSNNKYSEQRTKKYILNGSLIPFFGKKPVGEITAHDIERYKAYISDKKGISNKTINNHLTVLKKCLSMAYDWLELEGAPPKVTWLKCSPPKIDYLTPEECVRLLSHADGIVYEMLLVALRTGMRQGELKGLQWTSIDWHKHIMTVRHSRCDYTKELGSPKSNRERHIPMHNEIYEILHAREKETGYVFLDADKHPFDTQRLKLRIAKVCKSAGLRRIGWHTLRHTFASHLAMKGVPLNAVQALMGHSNITTTMRYAHLAPSALHSAIDLLNPTINPSFGQPVGNEWLEAQQDEFLRKSRLLEKP